MLKDQLELLQQVFHSPTKVDQHSKNLWRRHCFWFLQALVEEPGLGLYIAGEPHEIKEFPIDTMPLRVLRLCPDPTFLCCCNACLCFLQSPVLVRHLGLKTVIVFEEPGDPGPELFHLPGLGERPDRWDDSVRSHPQLRADLLQCHLHGFVLNPGLPDAPCHTDEGFLYPFLFFLQSRSLRLGIRSTSRLLSPWLWFRWNRT